MPSLTASRRRRPDHEPKRRSRSPRCPNPAHSTPLRRITRQPAAATAAAQKASRNEETAADSSSLLPASGLPAPPARNHRAASGTKLSEVVSTRNIQAQRPTRAATWLRICAPTATPSPAEKAAAARPAQQLHGVASNELLVDSARCKADRGVRSHHRFGKQSEGEPRAELIEREREILELVAGGLSNADIAQRLVIRPLTVKTHVARILGKLDYATVHNWSRSPTEPARHTRCSLSRDDRRHLRRHRSADVFAQPAEHSTQGLDVVTAEARSKLPVEGDDRFKQAAVECVAGPGQLNLNGTPINQIALSLDEPRLFEPIEVSSHRRALDADVPGELELTAPPTALECVQDQPDRDRAALGGKRIVESASDRLGRRRQQQADWWAVRSYASHLRSSLGRNPC
jgi:DNA-binding CsgD family transcriptional regulator